jgi:hypothetical protein
LLLEVAKIRSIDAGQQTFKTRDASPTARACPASPIAQASMLRSMKAIARHKSTRVNKCLVRLIRGMISRQD